MRSLRRVLPFIVICAALARCGSSPAAPPPARVTDPAGLLQVAREIMAAAAFCTLITLDEEGRPRARIMDPTAPDAGMRVTVMTNPLSRKVRQIERDPRVTLLYFDSESRAYVTIIGRAIMIVEPAEKRRRWVDRWSPHVDDPEQAILYEVIPERLEVVSPDRGVLSDPATWTPPAVDFP